MSATVGFATLNIIPSAKGFGKALTSQITPDMDNAGRSGGNALFAGISSGLSRSVQAAVGAVGTIGGALVGLAAVGGFNRALAIDQATAKLTGLGHSTTEVDAIMKNALASVKGTAFGLGDAAGVAASLVASGIAPGQQLQSTLRTVADTASIAGISMSDMGAIFGSVAARGKLAGDDMLQLTSRGVPVLQMLSKQLGVSSADISDMVSKGQIDFATFSAAMEAGMGGAAIAFGQTFTGSLQNAQAALGRLGALFIQPALPVLTQAIVAATGAFDALGIALAPLVDKWKTFLASDSNTLVGSLGALLPILGLLGGLLGPILTQIPILGSAFAGLTGPIGLAAGALIALFAIDPAQLAVGVQSVVGMLTGLIGTLATSIAAALPMVAERVAANLPQLIGGFQAVLVSLATAVPALLPPVVAAVVTLIPGIANALILSVGTIIDAGTQLLLGLAQAVPVILPNLLGAVVGILPELVDSVLSMLPQVLDTAVKLFTSLADSIPKILPNLLQTIVSILPSVLTSVLSMLPKLLSGAIELFLALVQAVPRIVPPLITSIVGLLPTLLSSVISMLPQLINGAVDLFLGIVKALPQIIPALINALVSLGPTMVNTLVSLVPTLISAGVNLIGGLVSGLWNAAGKVGSALLSIAKNAIGDFLSFLGIHSPSRLFMSYGGFVGQGFADGISSMESEVTKATLGLASAAEDAVSGVSLAIGSNAAIERAIESGDGGTVGRHLAKIGAGNSQHLTYTQVGGQGLTSEQELVVAARRLQHTP